MKTQHITSKPYRAQCIGAAGLRLPIAEVSQPHYMAHFIQAVFDTLGINNKTIVIGGDGRYFNQTVIALLIRMASAQCAKRIIIAQDGLLSTPAASHLIRTHQADYGFILSAGHNNGGKEGDFGVKICLDNGAPMPEQVSNAINQNILSLNGYTTCDTNLPSLAQVAEHQIGQTTLSVINAYDSYLQLMQTCFDFPAIKAWLSKHSIIYEAFHGVTGSYAQTLLQTMLDAPNVHILHPEPMADFGGLHPDPSAQQIQPLRHRMAEDPSITLGAAGSADGERYLLCGQRHIINPCDSLAVIAANHQHIPCLRHLKGVARSMPTSRAIDTVAQKLGIPCYETPTGWHYFANLLDNDLIGLCGEESFGTSGSHLREKDGLWAILCWLNILAATDSTPDALIEAHWAQFGRHHFNRYDYSTLEADSAQAMLDTLAKDLPKYIGQTHYGLTITTAGHFNYTDPTSGIRYPGRGVQIQFGQQARLIIRLSDTAIHGITLRIYCEYWQQDIRTLPALAGGTATLVGFAQGLLNLSHYCQRNQPDHIV